MWIYMYNCIFVDWVVNMDILHLSTIMVRWLYVTLLSVFMVEKVCLLMNIIHKWLSFITFKWLSFLQVKKKFSQINC